MSILRDEIAKIKELSLKLQNASTEDKNKALESIAIKLRDNMDDIIEANKIDIINAKDLSNTMINRLSLNQSKIESIISSIYDVIKLPDPINEIIESIDRPNDLKINKVRVPFGTICAIFESRPNVCVDITVLCIKTGNACVLKGGKEAIETNKIFVKLMQEAIEDYFPKELIYLVTSSDREITNELITMHSLIDLVVPRGGKGLINYVVNNCRVPYIETGAGLCHIFLDHNARVDYAIDIIKNAKLQNPAVCNAVETVLIDPVIAPKIIPLIQEALNIPIYGCELTQKYITCLNATEENYFTEYGDLFLNMKVCSIDEAIKHIRVHSTHHSEAIISEDDNNIVKFFNNIDSACVYHNASTRFTDGGCFGFGAELGISTQKLHARGPMGLKEMTTYRYKIYGKGTIR